MYCDVIHAQLQRTILKSCMKGHYSFFFLFARFFFRVREDFEKSLLCQWKCIKKKICSHTNKVLSYISYLINILNLLQNFLWMCLVCLSFAIFPLSSFFSLKISQRSFGSSKVFQIDKHQENNFVCNCILLENLSISI